jgi:carbon monoxide dehydrogenase subunit G
MKVPYAMEVDCTPEILWTYLTDPSKQKQWMKGLESVEREGDGPLAPGSPNIGRQFRSASIPGISLWR